MGCLRAPQNRQKFAGLLPGSVHWAVCRELPVLLPAMACCLSPVCPLVHGLAPCPSS